MVHSKSSMGVALNDGQGAQCFQGESIRMLEENGGAALDPCRKGDLCTLEEVSLCHTLI